MSFLDAAAIERDVSARGMSMNEFFRMADINKSTWHRWFSGETLPNTRTLERVQKAHKAVLKKPVRE